MMLIYTRLSDQQTRVIKQALTIKSLGYKVCVLDNGNSTNPTVSYDIEYIRVLKNAKKSFSKTTRFVARIVSYLVFQPYSLIMYYFSCWSYFKKNIDIVHCFRVNTLPLAMLVKLFYGVKVVYDAREFEMSAFGLSPFQRWFAYKTEKLLLPYVDHVTTLSDRLSTVYARLYRIKRPSVIWNCSWLPSHNSFNLFREKFCIEKDSLIFLYNGRLSEGRCISFLLDVFSKLDKRHVIVFLGYGPLVDTVESFAQRFDNIFYHPAVKTSELYQYTASADLGLCLIEHCCKSYTYCVPNKFFEYCSAGLPVIICQLPDIKRFLDQFQNGLELDDISFESFKSMLDKLSLDQIKSMGEASLRLSQKYNWESNQKVLINIYHSMANISD